MIDPMTLLAFSVYSGKGVYALLLERGVSRASGIIPHGLPLTLRRRVSSGPSKRDFESIVQR
jgi:hypothetical protein